MALMLSFFLLGIYFLHFCHNMGHLSAMQTLVSMAGSPSTLFLVRICQSMYEYVRWPGRRARCFSYEDVRVCTSMSEYLRVCPSMYEVGRKQGFPGETELSLIWVWCKETYIKSEEPPPPRIGSCGQTTTFCWGGGFISIRKISPNYWVFEGKVALQPG